MVDDVLRGHPAAMTGDADAAMVTRQYPSPMALTLLVIGMISLRLGLSVLVPRVMKQDEPVYLLLGQNWLSGNGFTWDTSPEIHHPPLFPFICGIVHTVFPDFETASNVAYAVFGGLLALPVFALAWRIYGETTAWLTALFLAVFPALNISVLYWGSMSEPPYLLFLYSGLAALLIGLDDERPGMFAAAGLFLGLAYLTRVEAIVYFVVFFIVATIWVSTRGLRASSVWVALGSFVVPFMLLAAPYIIYLHAHTGQWMVSGKLHATWDLGNVQNRDVANGLDSSGKELYWFSKERFEGSRLRAIVANPGNVIHRMMYSASKFKDQFFTRLYFWWPLIALVALALFGRPWDRRRLRHELFLMTIIIVLMLAFFPFGFLVRFFAPAFPVLLMWTARGVLHLGEWLQASVEVCWSQSMTARHLAPRLTWVPAGMAVALFLGTMPSAVAAGANNSPFALKEAGLWLKAHTPANAGIMVEELAVALYAGRRYIASPNADWARFLNYARAHRADYLVTTDVELTRYRPHMAFILDGGAQELELVATFEDSRVPMKTLVYRFKL